MSDKTDELLLLTYSPVLHDVALKELMNVLQLTITTIDGESYMLGDVRIDEDEHKIYGRGHKIKTYEEYK